MAPGLLLLLTRARGLLSVSMTAVSRRHVHRVLLTDHLPLWEKRWKTWLEMIFMSSNVCHLSHSYQILSAQSHYGLDKEQGLTLSSSPVLTNSRKVQRSNPARQPNHNTKMTQTMSCGIRGAPLRCSGDDVLHTPTLRGETGEESWKVEQESAHTSEVPGC